MFKVYAKSIAEEVVAKMANLQVGDVNPENGTFEVIASTDAIDRHGERILAEGWKTDNYMKNPIILFGHDYWNIESVVGKATSVEVVSGKLIVKGVFASGDTNPKAQMLRKMYDEGIIRTVSVGLRPLARDVQDRDIITSAELLELSFVPVPANPEALRLSKELGAEEVIEEIKEDPTVALAEEVKALSTKMDTILETLQTFANGKAISDAETEQKELVQQASRALSEALRSMKKR